LTPKLPLAGRATEELVEYIRARREVRHALIINDPQPVDNIEKMWLSAGSAATIGIFLLLFGGFLYVGKAILLPVIAAAVVSLTLAPIIKAAQKRGVSPWITATLLVVVCFGALALVATALAGPVSEWIGRAPEIGATIRTRLSVFDEPLAALHQLENTLFGSNGLLPAPSEPPNVVLPVVAFVTPAAGEVILFFFTLMFFLVGQIHLRNQVIALFSHRDSKLRFLKIMKDIEGNLAGYLTVVTGINVTLGIVIGVGAWLIGLPNPAIFGLLAALFNYLPYVGPAVMVVVLFSVGLVTFPSLGHALIAPLGLIAITTAEGHFITPTIVGRRLTLSPLLVFLALAFWSWMWGPIGAFLAVPLSIVGLVVFNHLFPNDDVVLPE
jgi:predicted PurR-regulated permease PerM